jgi:hypothetical protein
MTGWRGDLRIVMMGIKLLITMPIIGRRPPYRRGLFTSLRKEGNVHEKRK